MKSILLHIYMCVIIIFFSCDLTYALTESIDLITANESYWKCITVVVADVPIANINNNIRNIKIYQILKGNNELEGTTCNVKFYDSLSPATYILFLQDDRDTMIYGENKIILGPIVNSIQVKSKDDFIIADTIIMLNAAMINIPGLKLARVIELQTQMRNHSIVYQFSLIAQASVIKENTSKLMANCIGTIIDYKNYPIDTVILADKLLIGSEWNSIQKQYGDNWKKSIIRKNVFEALNKEYSKNDYIKQYILDVASAFTEIKDDIKK